ncbi:MAG TPA: DegT/DnrJ/EryC1/StrS family aminotransferase [Pirellulales bacterium]|nr:DegT/DnrJ/EryC1/StrS family aminotransferase [Pirellulales bacterium]
MRKRVDIGWSDLGAALAHCLLPDRRAAQAAELERLWSAHGDAVACLSVRSGFDLWLSAMDFPAGSEVLVSAITIPDMLRIIEDHGLVPVPVDIDPDNLAIDPASLEQGLSPKTRAILVAHLFGTRQSLEGIAAFARQHRLLLVEDCAQAFVGTSFTGDTEADVSMFSFGPIKTATALGGGLLRVPDHNVRDAMRRIIAEQPLHSRWTYARRVLKYAGIKFLTGRLAYAAVFHSWQALGRDPDQLVNGAVRGFAGPGFFERIRRQPAAALLALMRRRIRRFTTEQITRRGANGQFLLDQLQSALVSPGWASAEHSFWVFPVLTDESARLIAALRQAGFDGSSAHSMCVVQPRADRPQQRAVMAERILPRIVYLPYCLALPASEMERMAAVVRGVSAPTEDRAPAPAVAAPQLSSSGQ